MMLEALLGLQMKQKASSATIDYSRQAKTARSILGKAKML